MAAKPENRCLCVLVCDILASASTKVLQSSCRRETPFCTRDT